MRLYEELQKASSEEDVKDIYINAIGIKKYRKNIIDIQTDEVWFEAKDSGKHTTYEMFTQLLHSIQVAMDCGDKIPPFLSVIDTEKAAIMKTGDIISFLKKKTIKWGNSASQFTKEALEEVSSFIGTHFVSYRIKTHGDDYINAIKNAIKTGEIIRTQITPDNLKQVFDKWVDLIGKEIQGVSETDYVLLFYADIMHDGQSATHDNLTARLLHDGNKPVFSLNGQLYNLGSYEGYRTFWQIYHKPPKSEYRNYLLERRDSLIPIDERMFKGAYYTPLNVVEKAYEYLNETLGKDWQKNYIVWDMCCGVGNLEAKHSNHRNIYMSTIDKADIDVMKAGKICVSANRFQYDYLNDDIDNEGNIDYSLTDKIPHGLRQAIQDYNEGKEGAKKILVLMNPPYAEASTTVGDKEKNKKGIVKNNINDTVRKKWGNASKELYAQFLIRISKEIPDAYIAMFSKLKHINSPNFEKFRNNWKSKYLNGFIVHSKVFEGIKGDFPIGFLIWQTLHSSKENIPIISEIRTEILDKNTNRIGEKKYYNLPDNMNLNKYIKRPKKNNEIALPLKNAVLVEYKSTKIQKSCNNMIGYFFANGNMVQDVNRLTAILSSIYGDGCDYRGLYMLPENVLDVSIVFTIRKLIKHTWINDRDQVLQTDVELSNDFKHDCLVWMLFNGSNLTAGANNLEWNNKKWSLVNHFIPYTEEEVGAKDRFESDFMCQYIKDLELSNESKAVLAEGLKLWQSYFKTTDDYNTREELKLNRSDVGWYQIRKALEIRNKKGVGIPTSFDGFKSVYSVLSDKLRPKVYEYGFLR